MPYVRSYVLKDGDLFLSLMADGGIYEFEASANSGATPAHRAVRRSGPVIYTCTNAKGEREELKCDLSRNRYAVRSRPARRSRPSWRPRLRPASGAKYEGQGLMFWEHQGEATVTWMNIELTCKPSK